MCLIINSSIHKKRFIKLPWQYKYKPKKAKSSIIVYKSLCKNDYGD